MSRGVLVLVVSFPGWERHRGPPSSGLDIYSGERDVAANFGMGVERVRIHLKVLLALWIFLVEELPRCSINLSPFLRDPLSRLSHLNQSQTAEPKGDFVYRPQSWHTARYPPKALPGASNFSFEHEITPKQLTSSSVGR